MGSKKKNKSKNVQEKTRPTYTVNSSATARNIPKTELRGLIFVCSNSTIDECFRKRLFGLPESHYAYVKKIVPGLLLFLFNYSDRRLHGIFEASSYGQLNIDSSAWTASGSGSTPFPAQVKFHVLESCQPLAENQFSQILAGNYYEDRHFWYELDEGQTDKLVSLFFSLHDRSSTSSGIVKKSTSSGIVREQVEDWEDLVDDPVPKRDEKVAKSSPARLCSAATSGLNDSSPQISWSALFQDEVPRGKTKESKDTDCNLSVGECHTSHCLGPRGERLETVKETEFLEEAYLSCDSPLESSLPSLGVITSVEASVRDGQVLACGPTESETKSLDLVNTVIKLSRDLEAMKSAHSIQADKIRLLEEKLDKSECKFKKVEAWFVRLKSTFTSDEDERDSIVDWNNDIHPSAA